MKLMECGNMERLISSFMGSFLLWAIFLLGLVLKVSGNAEGDALSALKNNLIDPNGALQSWDATLVTPCTWFHVTCTVDSVTRVDLGNANLSGQLVPQLGLLPNLQYLNPRRSSRSTPPSLSKLSAGILLPQRQPSPTPPIKFSTSPIE